MAHLYFVELGNLSYYTTTGANSAAYAGGANSSSTLDNVGPFTNFQSNLYWSGTEYAPKPTLRVALRTPKAAARATSTRPVRFYALAVRPGDVAAVPEAATYALMLAGLGLVGWRVRRRG